MAHNGEAGVALLNQLLGFGRGEQEQEKHQMLWLTCPPPFVCLLAGRKAAQPEFPTGVVGLAPLTMSLGFVLSRREASPWLLGSSQFTFPQR